MMILRQYLWRRCAQDVRACPSGQAIVFFVLAIVGLVGVTGLAIDGGRVALEKRRAQAAADAAAMAGGLSLAYTRVLPNGEVSAAAIQEAIDAALARAAENGYDNDGVRNTVTVTVSGPRREGVQWVYYVDVDITSAVDPALIQVVYSGPLNASVHAQSRVRPYQDFAQGFTLLTTGSEDPGLQVRGSSLVDVEGNIWVNSSTTLTGAFTLRADELFSVEPLFLRGGAYTLDATIHDDLGTPLTLPPLPEPVCSGPDWGRATREATYQPGRYDSIRITGSGRGSVVTFEPGLYCIDGDLRITGSEVRGEGVMFYVRRGSVHFSGNAKVFLTAPTNLTDAAGNQWRGMLFYLSPDNRAGLDVAGTADFFLDGTVYVPGPANPESCTVRGDSATMSIRAQFICHTMKVVGNGDLMLRYPSLPYQLPPVLDLTE